MPSMEVRLYAAIKKHCLLCSGRMKDEVDKCTIKDCPLYPFRLGSYTPVAKVQKGTAKKKQPKKSADTVNDLAELFNSAY